MNHDFEIDDGILPPVAAVRQIDYSELTDGRSVWYLDQEAGNRLMRSFNAWAERLGIPLLATFGPTQSSDPRGAGWRVYINAMMPGQVRPASAIDYVRVWSDEVIVAGGSQYRTSELYNHFRIWAAEKAIDRKTIPYINTFTSLLKGYGYSLKRKTDGWYMIDIDVSNPVWLKQPQREISAPVIDIPATPVAARPPAPITEPVVEPEAMPEPTQLPKAAHWVVEGKGPPPEMMADVYREEDDPDPDGFEEMVVECPLCDAKVAADIVDDDGNCPDCAAGEK